MGDWQGHGKVRVRNRGRGRGRGRGWGLGVGLGVGERRWQSGNWAIGASGGHWVMRLLGSKGGGGPMVGVKLTRALHSYIGVRSGTC